MSQDWNVGKDRKSGLREKVERAVLVGLVTAKDDATEIQEHLDELEFLAQTAGAETVKQFIQKLPHPDKRSFVGKGKLEEIGHFVEENDIDLVIFDNDLTPSQTNFLEKELKRKIIDRSFLILDIFARRAKTAQAKTQVELAQMQYLLPRLRGLWTHLERQKGGIGMRGPGEQEIETDRRIVRDKISKLKAKLEKISLQNVTQRKNRGQLIRVALVGYTNVGKSTILNLLTKSDVLAENKLFATLDTTVRKVVLDRMPFLMSDTVGFIRKLPHDLIESFKSTLDETRESDLLIHVVDVSHPQYLDQLETVNKTLKSIGVEEKPMILVLNKLDQYRAQHYDDLLDSQVKKQIEADLVKNLQNNEKVDVILLSAKTNENIDKFRNLLEKKVRELYEIRYPYQVKHW